MNKVLLDIVRERNEQDKKWGEQNHDPITWVSILVEEVGEIAQAALHTKFDGEKGDIDNLREEMVQTGAVVVAMIECLDRNEKI